MGTLGFLLPFRAPLFPLQLPPDSNSSNPTTDIDDFAKALHSVYTGKATILNRMRLACTFYDKDRKKTGGDDDGEFNENFYLFTIFITVISRLASHE